MLGEGTPRIAMTTTIRRRSAPFMTMTPINSGQYTMRMGRNCGVPNCAPSIATLVVFAAADPHQAKFGMPIRLDDDHDRYILCRIPEFIEKSLTVATEFDGRWRQ